MFQGFNESTIMYYKAICRENCKKVYQDNEQLAEGDIMIDPLGQVNVCQDHIIIGGLGTYKIES